MCVGRFLLQECLEISYYLDTFGYCSLNFFETYDPRVSPAANVVAMTMKYVESRTVFPSAISGKKFILMRNEAIKIPNAKNVSKRPIRMVPEIFREKKALSGAIFFALLLVRDCSMFFFT